MYQLLLPLSLEPLTRVWAGLWLLLSHTPALSSCLHPQASQASRSCTKSMWRYSADTCVPQQCCPAQGEVSQLHPVRPDLLGQSSAPCPASQRTPHPPELCSEQLLSRKWKSMQGWILTVDVRGKLTLGVSLVFKGFLSGLPFRVRTYVQRAPWIPWIFSHCKFQTSPSTTVLLSV